MKPRILVLTLLGIATIHSHAFPQWQRIGDLAVARCSLGAIYIGEGKVLVMGGSTRMPIESDPLTVAQSACDIVDVWKRRVRPTGPMTLPRSEFVALLTPDSNVVVLGGVTGDDPRGEVTASVELYDRRTETWRVIGAMTSARRQHVGGFIDSNTILITGGRSKDYTSLTSSELFDMRTGTSTPAASFPYPINAATCLPSHSGELVVVGGRTGGTNSERRSEVYTYNAREDYWTLRGVLAQAVSHVSGIRLWDQRMLICGGLMRDSPLQTAGDVQLENEGKWIGIAQMGKSRVGARMAQWSENRLLVIGGVYDDHIPLAGTEWVNLGNHTIKPGPEMSVPRDRFMALSVPASAEAQPHEHSVVVIGGIQNAREMTASVELLAEGGVTLDLEELEALQGRWTIERTGETARLHFALDAPATVDIHLVAVDGTTALHPVDRLPMAEGNQSIGVDLSRLVNGWYMIEMMAGRKVWRQAIVIAR
jgi:hypothetical protein